MYFECLSDQFSEFSTIFQTITSNEYSNEQKEEMMQLFKSQTVDKFLYLIKRFSKIKDDISELSDLVLEVVEARGKGNFDCQEFFLKLFDAALEEYENSDPTFGDSYDQNSSIIVQHNHNKESDNKRKIDLLSEEIKILKEELEDKGSLFDDLVETNRNFSNLKDEFSRINEKCAFLCNENNSLKIELTKINDTNMAKEFEWKIKEDKIVNEIEEMKEIDAEKSTILKELEREKELMFNDFQLLSDEIVERDFIIQSLSEASEDHRENETFINVNRLDKSYRGEDPNSDPNSLLISSIPSNSCENCLNRKGGVYFSQLNTSCNTSFTSRRRRTPSPTFEDSFNMPEVENFSQRSKSLSDELMEVKFDMVEERNTQLREVFGQLSLLERELRERRQSLEKSLKMLLNRNQPKQKPNTMIRTRVKNGKMSRMEFTKYEGVLLS